MPTRNQVNTQLTTLLTPGEGDKVSASEIRQAHQLSLDYVDQQDAAIASQIGGGEAGANGWSPLFSIVSDGQRRVLQIIDWTGGTGTEPVAPRYVGASGLTTVLADAVDIRGAEGQAGSGEGGGGVSSFSALTDASSAELPTINTPLNNALAAKAGLVGGKIPATQLPTSFPRPFSQSIPLDSPNITMDYDAATGPTTLVPNTIGAVELGSTKLMVKADGNSGNIPNVSAWLTRPGSPGYDNTAGKINEFIFLMSGGFPTVCITPLGNALTAPAPPTSFVVNDGANTAGWTNAGGKNNSDAEISFNSGATWVVTNGNPHTGITGAYGVGVVRIRYKAVLGVSTASAAISNGTAYTGTNQAPTASGVSISGTVQQGQTLTGTYTYADAESDAEGATVRQWYRADNNSGLNRAAISGATNATYVLQAGDVNKYIQHGVTPKAATGTATGTEQLSPYTIAVTALGSNAAPVASSVAISGTATQGQTLTGTYTYSDAEGDSEGASTKQWYRADDGSGTNRVAISGATNTTYVLQVGDVGKFVQYVVTPVALTGTTPGTPAVSSYTSAVASPNVAPVASSVAITGTAKEGMTLTRTYVYSDADSDAEGASITQWYRADNNSGLNRAAIAGATGSTYIVQLADVNKVIQSGVTPVAATGTSPGVEAVSAYTAVVTAPTYTLLEDKTFDSDGSWTRFANGGSGMAIINATPELYLARTSLNDTAVAFRQGIYIPGDVLRITVYVSSATGNGGTVTVGSGGGVGAMNTLVAGTNVFNNVASPSGAGNDYTIISAGSNGSVTVSRIVIERVS